MVARQVLAAVVYFGVALFLALAFVSYDGVHALGDPERFTNLGGEVGATLARSLIMSFGVGAFGLAFFLLFIGYSLLIGRDIRGPWIKCVGALLLMVALATTVQAMRPDSGYRRSDFPLGGITGEYFAHSLFQYFGGLGTGLILVLLMMSALVLASDTFVFDCASSAAQTVSNVWQRRRAGHLALAGVAEKLPPRGSRAAAAGRRSAFLDREKTPPDSENDVESEETGSSPIPPIFAADEPLEPEDSNGRTFRDIPIIRSPVSPLVDLLSLHKTTNLSEQPIEAVVESKKPSRRTSRKAAQTAIADEPEIGLAATPQEPDDEPFDLDSSFSARPLADEVFEAGDEIQSMRHDEDEAADDEDELTNDLGPGNDQDDFASLSQEPADDAEFADEEEEIDTPPVPAAVSIPSRVEPVIRSARSTTSSDDIEIVNLVRASHLAGKEPYKLPPLSLLADPEPVDWAERDDEIRRKAHKLEETLQTFGITAQVVEIARGPTITMYEVELAAGTKVKKITSLPDDISMALKAKTIRIVAPIPGKSTVGIEVPNDVQEKVMLKDLALSELLRKKNFNIPLFLGKDATGNALIEDLTSMPHLLIAGQTGSGKSVCINTIIASLLLTKFPDEVRLILIDPKMVEMQQFRNVPHLMTPVVTDMKKAPKVLEWACTEMDQRYNLLSAAGVRDIRGFNELSPEELKERLSTDMTPGEIEKAPKFLPYIVVVIDELADLMMMSAKEVEGSICRLAQKSRAIGIHVIVATQRPSVDVITGLIKSNLPSRISFRVASKIDSRTILDQMGADRLLGHGDMLFIPPRGSAPVRCQAALVSEKEIKDLVKYVKDVAQSEYSRELTQVRSSAEPAEAEFESSGERDPLYDQAVRFVLETQRGSVSTLQRKFEIGYTRAARLVDFMAEDGIVGAFKGSKAREVLVTLDQWDSRQKTHGGIGQAAS